MFFFESSGFLAGLQDFRPLSKRRLLMVRLPGRFSGGSCDWISCDWILADDARGDRFDIMMIELSVVAEVTRGRPLRFRDLYSVTVASFDLLMQR
jgi:hypothetical protein